MPWNTKITLDLIRESFSGQNIVSYYARTALSIGLWNSEKALIQKYFTQEDRILDLGCGTGRTTIPLYQNGYTHVIGLDISDTMIQRAEELSRSVDADIEYVVGNACALPFPDESFDSALFSYNGMMQIPGKNNRKLALSEIQRVLKPGGIFIFTSHDKESSPEYGKFWREEERKWRLGQQDKRLLEFGDIIIDEVHQELFIHISTNDEIENCLTHLDWKILESLWRPDICEEKPEVLAYSSDNRFWVVQKKDK